MRVTFRRLTDDDLPQLHRWLNEPGVVRWWEGDDVSWDAVVADYGSTSTDPTEHWIAVVDGEDVGWISCYAVITWPTEADPWRAAGIEVDHAAGIDYLLGDPARRARGLGPLVIRAFVTEIVFGRHPAWTSANAAPVAANRPSWRALEKAGFRFVAVVDEPPAAGTPATPGTAGTPGRLMTLDRPARPAG